jgi:DNA-binding transcriptional regulator LsrR (DeoR family)
MEKNNLNLTALETQVMESLIGLLYAEPGFSDVDAKDIAEETGIGTRSIRGVLSSLIQKSIIGIEPNSSGYQIIYLNEDYWWLHPTWKNEKL